MKKIIMILPILFGCAAFPPYKDPDFKNFTHRNDTIFYKEEPVAVYTSLEWEYYRGKKTLEISFNRINGGMDQMTDKIVDFIRIKYPLSKVEVKVDAKNRD